MDAKEALRYFNFVVTLGRAYYPNSEAFKAYELAVEALEKVETLEAENARLKEKETPKKANDQYGYYYCPQCHNQITTEVFNDETQEHEYAPMKFCPYCGQAINNDKE